MHETARILLYGLLGAASPTVLLATLVVLSGGRGRANGIAFMAAFLLGTSIAFTVGLFVGHSIPNTHKGGLDLATFLELAAGVLLLVIALHERPPHEPREPGSTSPAEAQFARFAHVKPALSFGIGVPLGIGAKRLTITLVAAATVALAGLIPGEEFGLGALYVVVASLTVWIPVVGYLLLGKRADDLVALSKAWIAAHDRRLTFISALVLGVFLTGDGLFRIAS